MSKDKHDRHHPYGIYRARKGDLGNFESFLASLTVNVLKIKHKAWNRLFKNHFPEEVILVIKKAFREGERTIPGIISFIKKNLNHFNTDVTQKDLDAWQELFNRHHNFHKIKKIILENWSIPNIRTVISNGKIIHVSYFLPYISENLLDIKLVFAKSGVFLKLSEKIQVQ